MSIATVKRSAWSKDGFRMVLRYREGSDIPWEMYTQPRRREHARGVEILTHVKFSGAKEALSAYRKHCENMGVRDGN